MTLTTLRQRIDRIDEAILHSLSERAKVILQVAELNGRLRWGKKKQAQDSQESD